MAVIVDTDSAGRVRRMYYEEDKMTPEERAVEIIDEGIVNRTWLTDKIEQAITAAVEEEREAWASRADKEASATTPVDTYYAEGYRGAMRYMAHLLRSTTSPADTEGKRE